MRELTLDFEPRLMEEAVLLAIERGSTSERGEFRRERETLYQKRDPGEREAGFQELSRRWFVRLELRQPLRQALSEQPGITRSVSRGFILPASSAKDEAADLHDGRETTLKTARQPVLVVRLRPASLLDRARLLAFLRHELQHVADMLDPEFGYERSTPAGTSPAYANLLRDRYRVLWDTTIDGRLCRRGLLDPAVEELRRREFSATFGMLEEPSREESFQRYFRSLQPRHRELWSFASQPLTAGDRGTGPHVSRRCPLCSLPTVSFHPNPKELGPAVLSAIHQDFSAWSPDRGLCFQCADLYASRNAVGAVARSAETRDAHDRRRRS
jgi:hypothetical protein